ncbi:unnamed protein product [Dimorphilus gyrociliatus]|uniref:Uncharacterized protein n=1 Tax=Dimorphilus gyrociliatus TaxID=2664684 RepID=A0A7I8WES0_9ANNE|nr:unnamed protein product [Dimorphilus gyrociliatus]
MASKKLSDILECEKPKYDISGKLSNLSFNPFCNMDVEVVKKLIRDKMYDAKRMEIYEWMDEKSENRNDIFLTMIMIYRLDHNRRKVIMSDLNVVGEVPKLYIFAHETILASDIENIFSPLRDIQNLVWNGTNCSAEFSRKCYEDGVVESIVKVLLTNWRFSSKNLTNETFDSCDTQFRRLLVGYLTILDNVLRFNLDLRDSISDFGSKEIICKLRENLKDDWKTSLDTRCLTILSYLINKDEIEMIKMNDINTSEIQNNLNYCLKSKNHLDNSLYPLSDSLIAINHLAVNDENKQLMSRYIPFLLVILQEALNSFEQKSAVECLKTLISNADCKKLLQEKDSLKILENLSENGMSLTVKTMTKNLIKQIHSTKLNSKELINQEKVATKRTQPLTRGYLSSKKKC